MTDIVSAMGLPGSFSWDGKTWTVAPMGPRVRAELTRWARERAKANIENEPSLSPAEKRKALDEWRQEVRTGYYDYGNDGATRIFGSDDGELHRLLVLLRPAHPDITVETVERMLREAGGELYAAILSANRPTKPTTK